MGTVSRPARIFAPRRAPVRAPVRPCVRASVHLFVLPSVILCVRTQCSLLLRTQSSGGRAYTRLRRTAAAQHSGTIPAALATMSSPCVGMCAHVAMSVRPPTLISRVFVVGLYDC